MPDSPPPSQPREPGLGARLRAWIGEPGSARRTLARNSAWESAGFLIYALVMFVLSPFIVHRLGNGPYGVWEMVLSLTGFLSFADLGVRPATVHFLSRYVARGDIVSLNRFVNSSFLTFAVGGTFIVLASVPLALILPRLWDVAPALRTEAALALIVTAGELGIGLPLQAFSAVLVGKQRYDLLGRVRVVLLFVRAAAIVVVLNEGYGLLALALVVAVTRLLEMAWYVRIAFRITPGLKFDPRLGSREAAGRLLRYGGWAIAIVVGVQVIWATDSLVIGAARSAAHVTFFAVGFKLALYAREFLRAASRVLEPATGALHGLGDREGLQRLLVSSVRAVLLAAGPILAYLLATGTPFLRQWMGEEFAEKSSGVLCIMTLAVLPAIASGPLVAMHLGTGRVRPLALLITLEAILNLALSVLLVRRLGIEGVALGTAIPSWLVHAFLLPWLLCRHYGLSWPRFVVVAWSGPLVAGTATWLVLRRIVDPAASYGWVTLGGIALAAVLIHVGAILLLRWLAPALIRGGPRSSERPSETESS